MAHTLGTRFTSAEEVERTKDTYEDIDAISHWVIAGHGDSEAAIEAFCELLKILSGLDARSAYDPDKAKIGRAATGQWLRKVGYIT